MTSDFVVRNDSDPALDSNNIVVEDREDTSEQVTLSTRLMPDDFKKIERVTSVIKELYPSHDAEQHRIERLVEQAYCYTDKVFGRQEAKQWGADFSWPTEVYNRDIERAIKHKFNLESMVEEVHKASEHRRLSLSRIRDTIDPRDPDIDRLRSLALGIIIPTSNDFQLNGTPPPLRTLYIELSGAVNKTLLKFWEDDLVFIVPKWCADLMGPIHYTPVHWTTKVGKKCGRALFDGSDDKWGPALNSDEIKTKLHQIYGEISHPSIRDIVQMVLAYSEQCRDTCGTLYKESELVLWKSDLKGAFTLLSFRPEYVRYLGCALTDDLVLLYHCGLFGWTGTPYAFQVITRVLVRQISSRVSGRVCMYVDDLIGICLKSELPHDQAIAREIMEGLLGPEAIAEDKWVSGRRIDTIGWTIDLNLQRVSIAPRNFQKIVYGFFSVNEDKKVQVQDIVRLASWSARYTTVLRQARPLTMALYAEIHGIHNIRAYKSVGLRGQQAIWLWRCLLVLMDIDEKQFCRSMSSFGDTPPEYSIHYDSSLTGVGVGLGYASSRPDDLTTLIGVGSVSFPFLLRQNSKYQNTVEFIAVVLGVACLARRGVRDAGVKLFGDSRTSLKWGLTERFRGVLGLSSAAVYILLATRYNISVVEAVHVPAGDNKLWDSLSRGSSVESLGFAPGLNLHLDIDPHINSLLNLCDPVHDLSCSSSLVVLWRDILIWMRSLSN